MSKWSEFYQNRINDRYLEHLKVKYDFFLSSIENKIEEIRINHPCKNINIIELGAGCGNITKILYNRLCHICLDVSLTFTTIEKDADMMNLLKDNLLRLDINKIDSDIFSVHLSKPPIPLNNNAYIIISHGLLEHLEDEQIRRVMDFQVDFESCLYYHFHYVPSFKYNETSFGDERLMTKLQWEHILDNKLNNMKIQHFNEGYDYVISGEGR